MRRWLILIAVVALAASACKSKAEPSSPPDKGSNSGSPEPVEVAPGGYAYSNYGVTATLEPDGDAWKLKVSNKTGEGQGKPGIYALDARDGKRVDGAVEGAVSLGDGQSKEFTVSFGPGFDKNNVGLMILLLGGENWGAFAAE